MSKPEGPPAPPGLAVLYADAQLIAVEKPAGLHTAPQGRTGEDTLLGRLLERFPEIAGLPGRRPGEPGLLHRLDRGTSGVVLAARTPEAFHRLSADFAAGRVRKEYLALCAPAADMRAASGLRPGQRFVLESRFAPFGPGRRKVRVVPAGGQDARPGRWRAKRKVSPEIYRTEAVVVQTRAGLALVRAGILRGFRHQVRAHLSQLGLPIAGDPLYGTPVPRGAGQRLYLHACAVDLAHPATGAKLRIDSPLPRDFALCYGEDLGGT
jgi:23S rRNA pseudouridine1911/1915/1917 synthase